MANNKLKAYKLVGGVKVQGKEINIALMLNILALSYEEAREAFIENFENTQEFKERVDEEPSPKATLVAVNKYKEYDLDELGGSIFECAIPLDPTETHFCEDIGYWGKAVELISQEDINIGNFRKMYLTESKTKKEYIFYHRVKGEVTDKLALDFDMSPIVEENRQHILWNTEPIPQAVAITPEGNIFIKADNPPKVEILNYDKGRIFLADKYESNEKFKKYFRDDNELQEVIDGTHLEYFSRIENIPQWEAFFIPKEESAEVVSIGKLQSPHLNKAIEELVDGKEHIMDIIKIKQGAGGETLDE